MMMMMTTHAPQPTAPWHRLAPDDHEHDPTGARDPEDESQRTTHKAQHLLCQLFDNAQARILHLALDEHEAYDDVDRLAELRHPKWTTSGSITWFHRQARSCYQTRTKMHSDIDWDANSFQRLPRATAVTDCWTYTQGAAQLLRPPEALCSRRYTTRGCKSSGPINN